MTQANWEEATSPLMMLIKTWPWNGWLRRVALVLTCGFSLILCSCIADPDFASGSETTALLEAYRAQSTAAAEAREAKEEAALKLDRVESLEAGEQPVLSVDLVHADFNRVIERVLQSELVEYRTEVLRYNRRVSARFSRRPLADGLNVLLDGSGLVAVWKDGMLSFYEDQFLTTDSEANDSDDDEDGTIVSQEVVLRYIAATDMVDLITALFSAEYDYDDEALTVGSLPELNAVFVAGPSDAVTEAVSVIRRADRPVAHVIIEALVVNIDTSSVESLSLSFTDGASGRFDLSTLVPGQTGGNVVASFSDLAANSAAVTATIEFLAAQNAAEILARPYVATRSTESAVIAIVDDQFARVDTSGDDSSIITTDSVTAGISMQITPIVMADQSIRIDINLEDSRFSATAGDIIIAKKRSTATTSMIVDSGQTIVIGGLNSRYRLTDKSGFPWLRHVPLLNMFTSDQGAVESREELVVYLTPYVWVPGLDTPLPLSGRPVPDIPDYLSLETGGRPAK